MDITPKPLDLTVLKAELATAGIVVAALGAFQRGGTLVVHTYTEDGAIDESLPAGAAAVIAAHVPPARPAYGSAANALDTLDQARTAVTAIQAYIGLATPTAAQTTAAVKLMAQLSLVMIRRLVG